jgi:hypothetical protein
MSVQGSLARGQDVDAVERPGAPRARSTAGNGSVSRSSRRGATLIVGALLAVTLAGCSAPDVADPSPAVERPVPSPSPTPTPTPEAPVKPERPADMERTDEVGAAAAAVYFLELYPYVMATQDVAEWELASLKETCELCTAVLGHVAGYVSTGQRYVGGAVVAEVVKVYPLDTLYNGYPVDVRARQANSSVVSADGTVLEENTAEDSTLRVELIHDGQQWRLAGVSNDLVTS